MNSPPSILLLDLDTVIIGALVLGGIVVLFLLFFVFQFVGLWIQALVSGAPVRLIDLIMMKFRKVNAREIVYNRISAKKAGINIPSDDLESHFLAGGRVTNVVRAMIAADRAKIALTWEGATAIDLAGRDILEAVKTSVDPKVIDVPLPGTGKTTIDAVATVRTNIARLVGGATEETVVARVGEGIVSAIGSAASHKAVLENPDAISKAVLDKGLDSGTAYEILSIDIADVDVGANIGAALQADQAEADKKRFQAEAEKRRAMAVAQEAEYTAEAQKNRALVILAEAEVPKAMAQAFRDGNMGIMDYYRMKNVVADTSMRDSIAGDQQDSKTS